VSTSDLLILAEKLLESSVSLGIVGGVGGPALPNDVDPGAGEDSHGVGVVVAAGSGFGVEVGGPGVFVAAVAGEVADGVAQLFVDGPRLVADIAGLHVNAVAPPTARR
jgi:hypothetical protein